MHVHILGIGGTFMSALALLAQEAGYTVTGSDLDCYPPVSNLLDEKGIPYVQGYEDTAMALKADCIIVGNAIKRGVPVLEAILKAEKPYTSGPQWLADNILPRYKVLAVAGTHGKTTTTAMLAFILSEAGLEPGFLIGGVASDFKTSATLGKGEWFVVEADEYDTAFFDKRPKFMHYRPHIAILNNLEYEHADIYPNLDAIALQFHYFLRTIPPQGIVLNPKGDKALQEVLKKGVFSGNENMSLSEEADWRAELLEESGRSFNIFYKNEKMAHIHWPLLGSFNVENGLNAFAASIHAGVSPSIAARALEKFTPVKRRLEVKSEQKGITIYDDFAHHPTAIAKTIAALKNSRRHKRIIVIMEFASRSMRQGIHVQAMGAALTEADLVFILKPEAFSLEDWATHWTIPYHIETSVDNIIASAKSLLEEGDGVLVMSNRGFENIHQRLADAL